MVLLNYALVGERGVSSIIVDELMTVAILKKEIKKDNPATITGDAKDLQLYLAKKQDEWLPDNGALNTLLESEIDTSSYLHMRGLWELRKPELFGPGVSLGKKVVHVLVVVPTEKRAASDPVPALVPAKKRRMNLRIAYAGPLHLDEFSVPMESISAFNEIQDGFSMEGSPGRPLYFLYGPHVATLWTSLGMRIEPDSVCPDENAFIKLATRGQRRFCLIVDDMDYLFDNKDLAKTFLSVLRSWKAAFYFCGFLGVGSHDLVHHYKVFRGDMKSSPFNVGIMIKSRFDAQLQVIQVVLLASLGR
ncbi:hypothetical protein PR001_g28425 [Phytophthora rubi]|uniref:Crinkler effector protein N-terminal domain-containing protein n=1 Tax=Phytophthora rubi TaxID=129364 RepID=A0A6A3HAY7_9STRA|nr:hypothetical protein PR001_g28425 [Phytophthora rubi]